MPPRSRAQRSPVPAVVVSRLGVDHRWKGRGLGTWLMWQALELAAAVRPAVRARLIVAHVETEHAARFVARCGFRAFNSDPRFSYLPTRDLYLPMRDLQATISVGAAAPHGDTGKDRRHQVVTRRFRPVAGGVGRDR